MSNGKLPIPYSRSQSHEEKYAKAGMDLFFGLARTLHKLHPGLGYNLTSAPPKHCEHIAEIKQAEVEIVAFKYCNGHSILRHPSIWHLNSSPESNLLTVRIVAVLAYQHFFRNCPTIPIMELANKCCLDPDPAPSAIFEVRRRIGLLCVDDVIKTARGRPSAGMSCQQR